MKKLCTILAALTLVVLCFVIAPEKAHAASVEDLTFELDWSGDSYYVSSCNVAASGDLVIPASYNGKPVTGIGVYAFHRCSRLTNVTIPDSVTSCSIWAFRLCDNLKGIWVDENNPSLCSDSQGALYDKEMTRLIKVPGGMEGDFVIPEGVVTIQQDAMMWCSKITSLTIPASLTEIEEEAMGDLNSLQSIRVNQNSKSFWSDSHGVLYSKDKTTLLIAPGKITGAYTIAQGTTTINDSAFSGCTGLTGLTIPDSLTSIGSYAFYDCKNLKEIYISDTDFWCRLSVMGGGANPMYYGGTLYVNNKPLTNLTVPDGVTTIVPFAFINCTTLKSVTLPDSVTTIGLCAFAGCSSLTDINIPDSVTAIKQEAFFGCTSLVHITLPDSVTELGESVFYECTNLESVNIPKEITQIPTLTFYACKNLKSITIPDRITYIGHRAFERCYSLTNVTVPDGVTALGNGAFEECTALVSIILPDSITSLGNDVFYRCESLQSIDLPKGLTAIPDSAFKQCYKLTDVTIPSGVTTIERWAFSSCADLTCVNIPGSVTNIAEYAFSYCYELTDVVYCGTEQQWEQIRMDTGNNWLTKAERSYHNYVDSVCTVCGAKNYPVDSNLIFAGDPGLSFQEYIGLQVMIKNSMLDGYDKVYVEISQVTPSGVVTTRSDGFRYNSTYRVFEQQIVSWSMTEQVTMTLYAEKNGILYQGAGFTTTVKDLAMSKLATYKDQNDTARCRALVDMLNYGAAVQSAYDYNANNLANADLGDYAALGTAATPQITAVNKITGSNKIQVYSANISLQDKVEFQFMVKTADIEGKLVVPMHNGKVVPVAYTTYGSYTIIRVAVAAANMRDTFKIAVYNTDGRPLTCIYNVSVEAYAKNQLGGDRADALIAMMKYGDAVAAIA